MITYLQVTGRPILDGMLLLR